MPKISGLPEDTAPTTDDYSVSLDNGTTTTKKVKWTNLISMFAQNIMLTIYNPYKFSVWRNGAFSFPNTATLLTFDTVEYDTSSNYSTSTGKFTAPVAGFYQFFGAASCNSSSQDWILIGLYKNGVRFKAGQWMISGATHNNIVVCPPPVQLVAGDSVYIGIQNTSPSIAYPGNAGQDMTYFGGYLVSVT